MKFEFSNSSYYQIHGWMIRELKLKGCNLTTFAIIYGFTRDGKAQYVGGHNYICEAGGYSERAVINSINELCDLGFLEYRGRLNGNNTNSIYSAWTKKVRKIVNMEYEISESCPVKNTDHSEMECSVKNTGHSVNSCPVEITGPNNIYNNVNIKENNNKLSKESSYTENGETQSKNNQNDIFNPLDFGEDDLLENKEEIQEQEKHITVNSLGRRKLIQDIKQESKEDLEKKIVGNKKSIEKVELVNKEVIETGKKKRYLQAVEKDISQLLGTTDKEQLNEILDWFDVIWDKGVKSTKHKSYIKICQQLLEFYKKYTWEELANILDTCIRNIWRDLSWAVPKQSKSKYNNTQMKRNAVFFDVKDGETAEEYSQRKIQDREDTIKNINSNYLGGVKL